MVVVLLLGLFMLVVGGILLVLVVIVFFFCNSYMGIFESLVLLVWGLLGIFGLLGWLWLSGVYLWYGCEGLCCSSLLGWIGIVCGVIGVLSVLVVVMCFFF